MDSRTMKAGKYYIGDPCYLISNHNEWMSVLEENEYFNNDLQDQVLRGYPMCAGSTAYGDGTYSDQYKEYPVDAGIISIVPVEALHEEEVDNIIEGKLGHFHTFDKDFEVTIEGGVFTFGNVIINTDSLFEDSEEDEYEYGDELERDLDNDEEDEE